mmetsp:Transcript_7650/g.15999  ORF Transcript_7650/g.15999 Transcript_7650/m.15999 type:complete len:300 (-) Transcript_7650:222-1121(-)
MCCTICPASRNLTPRTSRKRSGSMQTLQTSGACPPLCPPTMVVVMSTRSPMMPRAQLGSSQSRTGETRRGAFAGAPASDRRAQRSIAGDRMAQAAAPSPCSLHQGSPCTCPRIQWCGAIPLTPIRPLSPRRRHHSAGIGPKPRLSPAHLVVVVEVALRRSPSSRGSTPRMVASPCQEVPPPRPIVTASAVAAGRGLALRPRGRSSPPPWVCRTIALEMAASTAAAATAAGVGASRATAVARATALEAAPHGAALDLPPGATATIGARWGTTWRGVWHPSRTVEAEASARSKEEAATAAT